MFGDDLEEEPDEPAVIVQGRLVDPSIPHDDLRASFHAESKFPSSRSTVRATECSCLEPTRGVFVGTAGHGRDSAARVRTTVTLHDASATTCDETLPR